MGNPADRSFLKRFPPYVWITIVIMFIIQLAAFTGVRVFLPYLEIHDLTSEMDQMIPFVKQWIIAYYLAFVAWFLGAVMNLAEDKTHGYRFAGAYILNLLISAVVFVAYPCTMVRPETTGTGLFDLWVRFTYWIDSPTNLMPSLHVSINYLCWRGTVGCQRIPKWFKWMMFIILILVCFSVVLVKQHVLIDIPTGLLAGEVAFQAARLFRLERIGFAIDRKLQKK